MVRNINRKEFLVLYECVLCKSSFHIKHEHGKDVELKDILKEAGRYTIHGCSDGRLGMAEKIGARIRITNV